MPKVCKMVCKEKTKKKRKPKQQTTNKQQALPPIGGGLLGGQVFVPPPPKVILDPAYYSIPGRVAPPLQAPPRPQARARGLPKATQTRQPTQAEATQTITPMQTEATQTPTQADNTQTQHPPAPPPSQPPAPPPPASSILDLYQNAQNRQQQIANSGLPGRIAIEAQQEHQRRKEQKEEEQKGKGKGKGKVYTEKDAKKAKARSVEEAKKDLKQSETFHTPPQEPRKEGVEHSPGTKFMELKDPDKSPEKPISESSEQGAKTGGYKWSKNIDERIANAETEEKRKQLIEVKRKHDEKQKQK